MEEWQKTLLSTGAGFIAGLLADPVRQWEGTLRKRRIIRRGIYRETAQNLSHLEFAEKNEESEKLQGTASWRLMEISSEVYDHYRATDAEVLFHLPEYLALKEVYMQPKGIQASSDVKARFSAAGLALGRIRAEQHLRRIGTFRLSWQSFQVERANRRIRKQLRLDQVPDTPDSTNPDVKK
jgi:hypothetical protein